MNWTLLQQLLLFAITNSAITVSFIQKTKHRCKCKHHIPAYSFIVNMILGVLFTYTFTDIPIYYGFWIGLFSYIGADSIYKTLAGKLNSYQDLTAKKQGVLTTEEPIIPIDNSTTETSRTGEEKVIGEIYYD